MKFALLAVAALVALVCFLDWSERRSHGHYLSDLRTHVESSEARTSEPNVVLVQAQLSPVDYQSLDHLRLKLDAILDRAQAQSVLHAGTLVVLPDHIGTWLIATGEKVEFYQSRDRYEVRDWLLLGNPLHAVKALLLNLGANRLDEALLRMKAEDMARAYQTFFSDLARRYGVTLVAGSIVLPSPVLEDGQLHAGNGVLRNVGLVFSPDGSIVGPMHDDPWPIATRSAPETISLAGRQYSIERDIQAGHPRIHVRRLDTGELSQPVFLRGTLDWPIGGVPRRITLSAPADTLNGPIGSHVIEAWSTP
ncbi:hydrolase [Pseudomonas sp. Marseille-QA0892]